MTIRPNVKYDHTTHGKNAKNHVDGWWGESGSEVEGLGEEE